MFYFYHPYLATELTRHETFYNSEGECQCVRVSMETVFHDVLSNYKPLVAELDIPA